MLPHRTSLQSIFALTSLNISMTLAGSFHLSKREICVKIGLSVGTAYFLSVLMMRSFEISLFFDESGSITG